MKLLSRFFLLFFALYGTSVFGLPQDFLINGPQVKASEPGTLGGAMARFNPSATDMARGGLNLPLPIAVDQSRGPLLINPFPSYSMENGLSEWGMGWDVKLDITRFRKVGDIDFINDHYSSPWGELIPGDDGFWYPKGLKSLTRVRIEPKSATAWTSDGLILSFDRIVPGPAGSDKIFGFLLSSVKNVKGQVTQLTWNEATRPVLQEIRFGGYSPETLAYSIRFIYSDLSKERTYSSYKAHRLAEIKSRVSVVQFFDFSFSPIQPRFIFELNHKNSDYSPAFYLDTLQKVFASGEREPALRYKFENFDEFVKTATFERVPGLERLIKEVGVGSFDNNHVSMYDHNQDGLLDVEIGATHKLFLQGSAGFTEVRTYEAINNLCLPPPASYNNGRHIVRIGGPDSQPMVLVNQLIGGSYSRIMACTLEGQLVYDETFKQASFTPDRLSKFGDVNGDGKPDFIRIGTKTIDILENTSQGNEVSFAYKGRLPLDMNTLPSNAVIADVNGDGISDIFTYEAAGARVLYGLGNYEFTAPAFMKFVDKSGQAFQASGSNLSFLDVNADGLLDLGFARGNRFYLLVNTGSKFTLVQMPFTAGQPNEGDAIVGNVGGGGEPMIFRAFGRGEVSALRLSTPGMHLLKEVDDGQGSVLRIRYGYASPRAGQQRMHKQVVGIAVERIGKGTQSFKFEYANPSLDPENFSLLGYGQVHESRKLASTSITFDNPVESPGLTRRIETRDLQGGVDRTLVATTEYVKSAIFGLTAWRDAKKEKSWRVDGASAHPETSQTRWEDGEPCPLMQIKRLDGDELTTSFRYASPVGLSNHVICLADRMEMKGRHQQSILDFDEFYAKDFNEIGQAIKLSQENAGVQHVLQSFDYDSLGRLSRLRELSGIDHEFSYEGESDLLKSHSSSVGQSEIVVERYPNGLAKRMGTYKGSSRGYLQDFHYDGQERLQGIWNNIDGDGDGSALVSYQYKTATASSLASLGTIQKIRSGVWNTRVKHLSSDGEAIAEEFFVNGKSVVSGLQSISSELGQIQTFGTVNPDSKDIASQWMELALQAPKLAETQLDGFGQTIFSRASHGKDLWERHSYLYEAKANGLLENDRQNERYNRSRLSDASGRVLSIADEASSIWQYVYDIQGRLRIVELPDGKKHSAAYDNWGNVVSITRDGVGSISYLYDEKNLKIRSTYFDAQGQIDRFVAFAYDLFGRIVEQKASKGNQTTRYNYFYDGTGSTPEIFHDEKGELTAISGPDFNYRFRHDLKGRLIESRKNYYGVGVSRRDLISYYADDRQKMAIHEYAGPKVNYKSQWDYVLDADGHLKQIDLDGRPAAVFQRDTLGRVETANLGSSDRVVLFHYDSQTQDLRGYTVREGAKKQTFSFQKDERGNVAGENFGLGNDTRSRSYRYDDRSFLVEAEGVTDESFAYDNTSLMELVPEQIPQIKNEDAAGRLINRSGWNFAYDGNGQLIQAAGSKGVLDFSYDQAGQRIIRRLNGELSRVWVDGSLVQVGEVWEILTVQGIPFGIFVNGSFNYVFADLRGSILETEGDFSVSGTYGKRNAATQWSKLIDYAGMPLDEDLGLVRMGVRDFDPQMGVFISADPLFFEQFEKCVGSPVECNLYSYAQNNPLSHVDPTGMETEDSFANRYDQLIFAGREQEAKAMIAGRAEVMAMIMGTLEDLRPLPDLLTMGGFGVVRKGFQSIAGVFGGSVRSAEVLAPEATVTLMRGISSEHPGYRNALRGIAKPIGGPSNAIMHSYGKTDSPFTSWTTDPIVARRFATSEGKINGVILKKDFPESVVHVTDQEIEAIFEESERLIKGRVDGAKVIHVQP